MNKRFGLLHLFRDIIKAGYKITREIVETHCLLVPPDFRLSWNYIGKLTVLDKNQLIDYMEFEINRKK